MSATIQFNALFSSDFKSEKNIGIKKEYGCIKIFAVFFVSSMDVKYFLLIDIILKRRLAD